MANKQIFQLPEKVTLNANDYIAISDSEDSNKTKHVKGGAFGNFANTDLTFTANRTHDIGSFELKLDGTVKIISPSASSLDTAFAVRNNTDTSNHFYIRGDGRVISVGTLEAGQGINISGGGGLNLGNANFLLTGVTGNVEMQAYNGNTIKLNPIANDVQIGASNVFKSSGTLNLTGCQVGNVGLVSGDTYFDTAANIQANGDLVMGRKV